MRFYDTVDKAKALLARHGRVSIAGLKQEFDLDDDAVERLSDELVDVQEVATRNGNVLRWVGLDASTATAISASSPALLISGPPPVEPAKNGAQAGRFLALNSCRGLCAVAVMLFHVDAVTHFYGWPPVRNAWIAVDFFFTLSGFVIASAYFAKLQSLDDAARFAIRRFGRLYPLHVAVLAVFVAVEAYRLWALQAEDAFADNTSVRALGEQLFLIQGFTANHESWNYPAWSISIELWVNFAFALLAVSFRRLFPACVFLLLAAGATLVITGDRWAGAFVPAQADALQDAVRSAFAFLLGFVAFRVYALAQARNWKPWRLAELAVIPLVVCAFGYAALLPPLVAPAIFFAVVLLLAFEAGPLSAMLRWSPLTTLGTYSYSIYLTHPLYLLGLEAAVTAIGARWGIAASTTINGEELLTLGGPWAMDGAGLACVAVAIFGSGLTYRFIEEPARAFFNRLSSKR